MTRSDAGLDVRVVGDAEWGVVAWLWQDFRHDLGPVVGELPRADGRYQHAWLDEYPAPDRCGYLAWLPHPRTGEEVPAAFALVRALDVGAPLMQAFFVVPAARRSGRGTAVALDVISRHDGAWSIPFQHDNVGAGHFWRRVATAAWGPGWTETTEPVPGKPEVPPDHWIRRS